jgi:hypothetical protein
MRVTQVEEPELEFGAGSSGRHIDIRFGLMNYGPATGGVESAPRTIRVGFVGTAKSIAAVKEWMEQASNGVESAEVRYPNYRPSFPGFGKDTCFEAEWTTDDRLERVITAAQIAEILAIPRSNKAVKKAAETFGSSIASLSESAKVEVIVCAPPIELFHHLDADMDLDEDTTETSEAKSSEEDDAIPQHGFDFHDMLKAKSLFLPQPIQFIRPSTYDPSAKETTRRGRNRDLQDPATRAWNFFTALYYKAGGTPWRLCRESTDLHTCYIGVSFYRSLDKKAVRSSVAQVFNERGEGMILRGEDAEFCEEDRQHHLSEVNMKDLLLKALARYEAEHRSAPARVVLHKTSGYNEEELAGCRAALKEYRVSSSDLLVLRKSGIRLSRHGQHPPLRGTFVAMDDRFSLLYTRGSVPFYRMYPGMYVPRALEIESSEVESPSLRIAEEILALTKMNWNNTQFDAGDPITIRAAKKVGNILKYVDPDAKITPKYSYFM